MDKEICVLSVYEVPPSKNQVQVEPRLKYYVNISDMLTDDKKPPSQEENENSFRNQIDPKRIV